MFFFWCFYFFNFYLHANIEEELSYFLTESKNIKYPVGRSQHLSIIFSRFERPIFQVQSAAGGPKKYSGPVDVIRSLYKEGGIRSIFKGSAATAARGKAAQLTLSTINMIASLCSMFHSCVAIIFMFIARYKHLSLHMNSVVV